MLWDILMILIIAAVLAALLVGAIGWRYPAREEIALAILFVFLMLFFVLWAANLWIVPAAPASGFYLSTLLWLLILGVLMALIIAAIAPPPPRRRRESLTEESKTEAMAFGIFFWVLILALLAVIVAGYAYA